MSRLLTHLGNHPNIQCRGGWVSLAAGGIDSVMKRKLLPLLAIKPKMSSP
jgi:hypothetical protein